MSNDPQLIIHSLINSYPVFFRNSFETKETLLLFADSF